MPISNYIKSLLPADVFSICENAYLSGSKEICNPPPSDTDTDIFVLLKPFTSQAAEYKVFSDNGFSAGGSLVSKDTVSWKNNSINIVTFRNLAHFEKTRQVTNLAKTLNIQNKVDRVKFFNTLLKEYRV